MKKLLALALIGLLGSRISMAQATLTASQAYEYLQNERASVRAVLGMSDKPPIDSLKKGERLLKEALAYYNQPTVLALAKTDKSLRFREADISYDLAVILAQQGRDDEAAQRLLVPLKTDLASGYASWINEQPAFSRVQKNSAIAPLLADSRVFNSNALKTPYQVNIGVDEKVAGLSKLWSEAKYNFVYFNHVPDLDWDKLYLQYLPKVQATTSTVAYYRVLRSFYAQLHDGHSDVWANDQTLADSVSRRPPIRMVLVDDKVLVQEVQSDSLLRSGIRPMLEVISVDGIPVKTYADQYVRPYVSASSVQNSDVNTYVYDLLRGPKNQTVTLVFRDNKGATFSRTLPRTGYSQIKPTPSFTFKILPGNVAYVQLTEFDSPRGWQGFKAKFDSISTTNALILDVRLNGGGNSNNGYTILSYLTDKPMEIGSFSSRSYSPLRRARGEEVVFVPVDSGRVWQPNGKSLYTKPVVVLTSGRTFSAAEDFAVMFDAMKRGTIIGEPTGGSTGQPLSFALPGGISARICAKRDMYPDGTEWNGKGIQPQVLVRPRVADMQAGRDTVLEAALAYLKK